MGNGPDIPNFERIVIGGSKIFRKCNPGEITEMDIPMPLVRRKINYIGVRNGEVSLFFSEYEDPEGRESFKIRKKSHRFFKIFEWTRLVVIRVQKKTSGWDYEFSQFV